MPRLDWLRMIVRKGGHGSRGIDHHIPLAEECAPLLLKLQPCRIGREPVAVARYCATRPLGMQTVIIGAQPCAHALRLVEGLRRETRAHSGTQELHVEPR